MKKLQIATSPSGEIFVGVPKESGMWGKVRQDMTIEALEQQVYDDNGFPEKNGKDHINDALGYAVSYLEPVLTSTARYKYVRHI